MSQKGNTKIKLLKGHLVLDGGNCAKTGDTLEVSAELLEYLESKRSPGFSFDILRAEIPQNKPVQAPKLAAAPVVPPPPKEDQDDEENGQDDELPEDADSIPGSDLDQDPNSNESQEGNQPGEALAASSVLGLQSVDAVLEASLAAAGLDTVEKLKTVSKAKLMSIKGVGKVRAEAILSEVGSL